MTEQATWEIAGILCNRKYNPMLEVLWAQQFTSLITHQHVQRAEDNLHKFRCETRSCAGSHIIKIEPICYELGNVSGKSSKERAKFSWSSKTEKFFIYCLV
ncbi:unnamed protein product [Oikopleura dioica]|uniref:Uncharacterized protein n=1 Tax=Oikopleura dioica TaxID=34765 RepID=E4Z1E6_OIKDI|nr:unnamed protein product [Oikopleura dioica]